MAKNVHEPEVIRDQPFPGIDDDTNGSYSGGASDSQRVSEHEPREIPERNFPTQLIANQVISDSFDSQSRRILAQYEFGLSGALQIGKYEENVSGDVRVSPTGIIGRNILGETTFTLDAQTGDATFKGTIAAGSLIAGRTDVGEGGNVFINGDPPRIIVSDGVNDRGLFGKDVGGF